MTLTTTRPPGAPAPPTGGRPVSTGAAVAVPAGVAVVAGSSALSGVLRGFAWFWAVLATVGLVVALGVAVRAAGELGAGRRVSRWVVSAVQLVGLVLLLAGLFSSDAPLGVLPGLGTLVELGQGLATAVGQIEGGTPPVATTAALRLLACVCFGVVAVAVDAAAAAGQAPAACGLMMLGAYTVPTALDPDALPDWSLAAGTLGYGLVLLAAHRADRRDYRRDLDHRAMPTAGGPLRRWPMLARLAGTVTGGTGVPLATLLIVLALGAGLGAGLLASPIGTQGRLAGRGHHDNGATDGQFGLNPFTSLRGQLANDTPVELLRVRGLPNEQYLRALTLTRYLPQRGWQLPDGRDGVSVNGSLPSGLAVPVNNPTAVVSVQNIGYLDQWLPLYGQPMALTGVVPGRWHYDVRTSTAYTDLPVREPAWTERAALPNPSVGTLEQSPPATDVSPTFLDTGGVDQRIVALSQAVTRSARSPFERAVALNRFFLDPAFGFRYSLRTRPGNTGDALVDFVTRGKTGYCEQFASAMAVMLRTVGVPARVAIGFSAGRPVVDYRSIGTGDAHAWVEAFFPGVGWLPFDPTPLTDGRSVLPNYVISAPKIDIRPPASSVNGAPLAEDDPTRRDAASPADQKPESAAPDMAAQGRDAGTSSPGNDQAGRSSETDGDRNGGSDRSGDRPPGGSGEGPGNGAGSGAGDDQGPAGGPGSWGWATPATLAVLLALFVALFVALAGPAAARGVARRYRLAQAARGGTDGAWAAWREVLAEFRDRGSRPENNVTLRTAMRALVRAHPLGGDALAGLKTVIHALEQGWYGEHGPGGGPDLVGAVEAVSAGLRQAARLPLHARLWPRSTLPGRRGLRHPGERAVRLARTLIGAAPAPRGGARK